MISRILVLEDDPAIVGLITAILSDRGDRDYAVVPLLDREALNYAVEQRPDAIILDMMLPKLPGSALLSFFREDPATRDIPVIVVTAVPNHAGVNRTLGAYATVHKPFRSEQLLGALEAALRGDPPAAVEKE